ncbi:hypothetical protein ABZ816_23745 [Actinosynnema sp. NPDC047251]|uniref:WXG100 family type VII secretion target n=1 Tax=Saccharothrix espanaensis (strain ATCC 51144 / DSM 44229 / JCM 9112 / NBRC 15066 / NRRL 15764) TaxID=1179773 RepID=K0K6I1_SACES|nr:hypothetical protein [Saccharothrix espanaensis]CCH32514.1 hypothetical protein BN6_52500 [Saccharothrix espanaensis DSM 44229]
MNDNPLIAPVRSSTEWYTGIGIAESVADLVSGIKNGDWLDIGLGGLTTGLEALSIVADPLGSVASNVLSFVIEHVAPLKAMLDDLAGNADAVAAQAATWQRISGAVGEARTAFERESAADTAGWTGRAADAYRARAADTAALLGAAAQGADGLGSATELAGLVVAVVRETVRDLIADLVGRLVVWAVEALTVVGLPVVAVQAATAAAKWGARIAQLVKNLVRTLQKLVPLLRRLKDLFAKIGRKLDELGGGGGKKPPKDPDTPPGSSGDPFDDLPEVEREKLIDELVRDSNPNFPLSRENAEAILRGGPPGTTPEVAGPGGEGADVVFRDANGEVVGRREAKASDGTYASFNSELTHATKQVQRNGEVWFQVPPGTDAQTWVRRWQGQRPGAGLDKYTDVTLVVRDSNGVEVGRYNLGDRLPPR